MSEQVVSPSADLVAPPIGDGEAAAKASGTVASPYAYYALTLLAVASFFNYVDRQIISIVAQSIKADLNLTDAQLGFLLGTAFAVFYGVVGIAIGRIADALSRTRLMAAGLALWSAMTALSGLAVNFAGLAAARIGVGVGEATASPCSHSLLSDYFPPRNRAAVLGVYLLGNQLGAAASLLLGGMILQHWGQICLSLPVDGACRIANWQAAFFIVGLPGLLLAVLIANLKEPRPNPKSDAGSPFRLVVSELSAAVPPFTLVKLLYVGGRRAVRKNLILAAGLVAGAILLGAATHDWAQWISVTIGVYSITTWGQVLSHRDLPLFKLTFGCPTFALSLAGGAIIACVSGTMHMWAAPYAMRELGASPGQAGLYLGVASAVSAGLSVTLSGLVTDRWKRHDRRAPMWMGLIALLGPIPAFFVMMWAPDLPIFLAAFFVFSFLSLVWSSGFAALVQDLVLPRMRGTAAAAFSLVVIVVASGVGPYWAGKISTLTGSLTIGLYSLLTLVPVGIVLLLKAAARLSNETDAARRQRAEQFGEVL
ncbi:MFS transporter [Phenylobacterium sp.]|jgi:MFS family permease|uniref:spinster family MFS transporter n=1 Tax=Phenylobacterium sp. TaxID=1871053 RepID=UPI002F3EEF92